MAPAGVVSRLAGGAAPARNAFEEAHLAHIFALPTNYAWIPQHLTPRQLPYGDNQIFRLWGAGLRLHIIVNSLLQCQWEGHGGAAPKTDYVSRRLPRLRAFFCLPRLCTAGDLNL